ncbi:MAG: sterol desaturase family protein [Agriterribacter sp.]
METYGKILLIAMPVFLAFVLFEKWYEWRIQKEAVRNMDMISSLSSGITNVTKDVLGLSFSIISYGWLVQHLAITHITATIPVYIIAFLALDFAGYWTHRATHEVNVLWNAHIIHHSSEEFNLACALRQSVSVFVRIFVILLIPAALLGIPEKVIAVVAPLHLFAQFWYHTTHIGKMSFLEKIIVTPSHHRVHHAINKEYLDKNYGQIFIFWDKWFGTYQEELAGVKPVYGITRPAHTWNPLKINFQHIVLLVKDAWRTKRVRDKFRIWLMPTGWRPEDMTEKYPVYKIEDVYNFTKYNPTCSKALLVWSWVQLGLLLFFISGLFANIAVIGSPAMFVYGLYIFLQVYALTDLADRNFSALFCEIAKNILGVAVIYKYGNWFGLYPHQSWINILLITYFILSTAIVALLVYRNRQEDRQLSLQAH